MNTKGSFVFIFRQGKKQLSAPEEEARTEEVRQWALCRLKNDPKFESRVLGDLSYRVRDGGEAGATGDSIIALNFIEASDIREAIEIAKGHPGLRYGVEIEVRPWKDPRANVQKPH